MKNTNGRFKDKVAIVTGAAEGMGRQVALDLANEGAATVISDIQEDRLRQVETEITRNRERCLVVVCDMASRQQVDNLIQSAVDTFGKIDILVNNAGVLFTGTIEQTTDEIIDKTLDVNVKGVFYGTKYMLPALKASGKAPARVATTGVPQAMDSAAGRPNPSYREGTTVTRAEAY